MRKKPQFKYVVTVPEARRIFVELLACQECDGKALDYSVLNTMFGKEYCYVFSFPKQRLRTRFIKLWRAIRDEDKKKAATDFLQGKGPKPSL